MGPGVICTPAPPSHGPWNTISRDHLKQLLYPLLQTVRSVTRGGALGHSPSFAVHLELFEIHYHQEDYQILRSKGSVGPIGQILLNFIFCPTGCTILNAF